MKRYISKWSFSRALRSGLGVLILIQGIDSREWFFIAIGAVFALMAVFNYGCCSSGACDITHGYSDNETKNKC